MREGQDSLRWSGMGGGREKDRGKRKSRCVGTTERGTNLCRKIHIMSDISYLGKIS